MNSEHSVVRFLLVANREIRGCFMGAAVTSICRLISGLTIEVGSSFLQASHDLGTFRKMKILDKAQMMVLEPLSS